MNWQFTADIVFHAQQAVEKTLTEYAWKFRYLGEADDPSAEEANRIFTVAREVFETIGTLFPEDFLP